MRIHAGGDHRSRTALVVAHPGHELLLHGWVRRETPCVYVLTDGSGRTGRSRLEATRRVLSEAGASPGSIFGTFTDRDIYAAVLKSDSGLFWSITTELASKLVQDHVEGVVADAAEGYNSTHDIVRLIVGAAVEIASRSIRQPIATYEYVVTGNVTSCIARRCPDAIRLELDEAALTAKVGAADDYAPLRAEIDALRAARGLDVFRHECLHRVDNRAGWEPRGDEKPYYEQCGERGVALGYYSDVIRYHQHIVPLRDALWEYVDRRFDADPDHQQHALGSGGLRALRS